MGTYRQRSLGMFDASLPLVAGRAMTVFEHELQPGDLIPTDVEDGIRCRLWMVEHAHYQQDYTPTPELPTHGPDEEWMDARDGVAVTEGENGWYEIKADWADEAEKVHGAENANARAEELRGAGDDKGVTFSHSGGGVYEIKAPWLEEPLKVKGKEAAEAKAIELREQGPPPPAEPEGGAGGAGAAEE